MINQEVIVNQMLQEQIIYEQEEFPLARFLDQLNYFADGSVLCHWHNEFEIALVLRGEVEYLLDQRSFVLTDGEGLFIGSQILHASRQLSAGTEVFNIAFPPTLLNLVFSSSLYQKYFSPLVTHQMVGHKITGETREGSQILRSMQNIHQSDPNEFAYELSSLEYILQIWKNLLCLLRATPLDATSLGDLTREQRIRKMVAFIQKNFSSPITIEDIANSASVSRSECFRCFSLFCNTSPMEYVNRYRLTHAAQQLIHTNEAITSICFSCGFSNTSYFGKAFNRAYHLSPSRFRQQAKR